VILSVVFPKYRNAAIWTSLLASSNAASEPFIAADSVSTLGTWHATRGAADPIRATVIAPTHHPIVFDDRKIVIRSQKLSLSETLHDSLHELEFFWPMRAKSNFSILPLSA